MTAATAAATATATASRTGNTGPVRDIYRVGNIASLLGVGVNTVQAWIDTGQLRGFRVPSRNPVPKHDGLRRVEHADLVDFLRRKGLRGPLAKLGEATGPECDPTNPGRFRAALVEIVAATRGSGRLGIGETAEAFTRRLKAIAAVALDEEGGR